MVLSALLASLAFGALTGVFVGLIVRAGAPSLLAVFLPDAALGVAGALAGATALASLGVPTLAVASAQADTLLVGAVLGALMLTSLVHALPRHWAL